MRFLRASDTALLVELEDLVHTMALHQMLMTHPVYGVEELVPAARTLLVYYRPANISLSALMGQLRSRCAQAAQCLGKASSQRTQLVEIPVHYNGEDLPEVAEILGVSVNEVIARHTGQPYEAAFAGFAPGFFYLSGGHPSFQLPRRKSPRTKVPAGSVGLAGAFSAVYPCVSPGGWQLIGVTQVLMWDLTRAEPAYLQPGFQVQFRDAGRVLTHISLPHQDKIATAKSLEPVQSGHDAIEFITTGLQTLVQDAGRHGLSGIGISVSGALDGTAMRQANRMVGNPVGTPILENLLGQLQLRCHGQATLSVTGAEVALTLRSATGAQWPLTCHQSVALDNGDTLSIHAPTAGVRCYVAVRGGWQVAPVLGSCATDTLSHIGPEAIQAGQRIAVGCVVAAHELRATQPADITRPLLPKAGDVVTLDVVLGPRTDWFTSESLQTFTTQEWLVTPQSNRVGIRITGKHPLKRNRHDELPSEGTVAGAIQVPINGQPVLFLADHPLTGGYPVIGAVASHHLDLAAQIPIGCRLRFNIISPFFDQN